MYCSVLFEMVILKFIIHSHLNLNIVLTQHFTRRLITHWVNVQWICIELWIMVTVEEEARHINI